MRADRSPGRGSWQVGSIGWILLPLLLISVIACSSAPSPGGGEPASADLRAVWEAEGRRISLDTIFLMEAPVHPEVRVHPFVPPGRLPVVTATAGILVPSRSGVDLLDARTGALRWSLSAHRSRRLQAVPGRGRIVLYDETGTGGRLRVLSEPDGTVEAERGGLRSGAFVAGDDLRIFFLEPESVLALDARTLEAAWTWSGGKLAGFTVSGFDVLVESVHDDAGLLEMIWLNYASGFPGSRVLGRVIGAEPGNVFLLRERQGGVWQRKSDGSLTAVLPLPSYDGRAAFVHEGEAIHTAVLRRHIPGAARVSSDGTQAVPPADRSEASVVRVSRDGKVLWQSATATDAESEFRLSDGLLVEAAVRRFPGDERVYDRLVVRDARTGVELWRMKPALGLDEFRIWGRWVFTLQSDGWIRGYRW